MVNVVHEPCGDVVETNAPYVTETPMDFMTMRPHKHGTVTMADTLLHMLRCTSRTRELWILLHLTFAEHSSIGQR